MTDEECGRCTLILYKMGTYAVVGRRKRYHHWQFTNISARIPLQSRFLGSPNISLKPFVHISEPKTRQLPPGGSNKPNRTATLIPSKFVFWQSGKIPNLTIWDFYFNRNPIQWIGFDHNYSLFTLTYSLTMLIVHIGVGCGCEDGFHFCVGCLGHEGHDHCCDGDGCHTREEYLDIKGIYPGLCMAFGMILNHFE